MTDVFSKEKRSEVMASVKGKGNKSTEWRLRSRLISSGVSGWTTHAKDILGKPDFAFREAKLAIFVDGCFWHGCKQCRNIPTTNPDFWLQKINRNMKRDRLVTRTLRKSGWRVMRFWEHQLKKNPDKCMKSILKALSE